MKKIVFCIMLVITTVVSGQNLGIEKTKLHESNKFNIKEIIRLTNDNEQYINPVFSYENRLIAFTNRGFNKIFVMNNDGSNKKELVKKEGVGYKFAWSLDNKEIAFRMQKFIDNKKMGAIGKVEITTGSINILTDMMRDVHPPQWHYSLADKEIFYVVDDKPFFSYQGSISNIIAKKSSSINDFNKAVFFKNNIYLINKNKQLKQLTFDIGFDPVWSPDYEWIVYSEWDNLVVININNGQKINLGHGINPSWSPNSKKIIYQVTLDDGEKITESDLYVINVDGSNKIQITRTAEELEVYPNWSPKGNEIVYSSLKSGDIYKLVFLGKNTFDRSLEIK